MTNVILEINRFKFIKSLQINTPFYIIIKKILYYFNKAVRNPSITGISKFFYFCNFLIREGKVDCQQIINY
jgi:hypothetical protein